MNNWIILFITSGVLSTILSTTLTLITSYLHDKNELKKSKLIERIGVVQLTKTELDYKSLSWYLNTIKTHNNNYDKKTYKDIEKRVLYFKSLSELSGISFESILFNRHSEQLNDVLEVSYIHFCEYSELICTNILDLIKKED